MISRRVGSVLLTSPPDKRMPHKAQESVNENDDSHKGEDHPRHFIEWGRQCAVSNQPPKQPKDDAENDHPNNNIDRTFTADY
jgi:hypothetical protein